MENWVNYAPFFGVAGVIFAFFLFAYVKSFPSGNEVMIDLEDQINKGAMAFLKREYSILVVFIAVGHQLADCSSLCHGRGLLGRCRLFRHERCHPGQLAYGRGSQ